MTTQRIFGKLAFSLMLMLLTVVVFAQRPTAGPAGNRPGGNNMQPPPGMQQGGPQMMMPPQQQPPMPAMQAGAQGLYLVTGETLAKFDAATLKAAGEVQLGADDAVADKQPAGPTTLAVITKDGHDTIMVVLGNTCYRIDGDKMKVTNTTELPAPKDRPKNEQRAQPRGQAQDRPGPRGPMDGGMLPPAPITTTLKGTTWYLLRGTQLLAMDTETGKLIAEGKVAMPTPPAPPAPPEEPER